MARQRQRASAAAVRRKRIWARDNLTVSPSAAGEVSDLTDAFAFEYGTNNVPPGTTVGGVLMDLSVVQTSARASSTDGFFLGIVINDSSVVASAPKPLDDPHADWLWYQYIAAPGSATGASESTFRSLGGPIRIRSRRRMDELGMRVFLVSQLTGTTTYDLRVATSVLLILP